MGKKSVINIDFEELIDYVKKYKFTEELSKDVIRVFKEYPNSSEINNIIYVNLCKIVWEHLYPKIRFNVGENGNKSSQIDEIMNILTDLYPRMINGYRKKFIEAGKQ